MTDELDISDVVKVSAIALAAHKLNDSNTVSCGSKSFDLIGTFVDIRPGSYRYTRPDTLEVLVVPPGDPMYSTAGMYATEMYNGEEWISLLGE